MSSEMKIQSIQSVNQGEVVKRKVTGVQEAEKAAGADAPTVGKVVPQKSEPVPIAAPNDPSTKPAENNTAPQVDQEEVRSAVQEINDFVQSARREIQFSVDDVTGRTVVRVYNHETKELIRQIPAEEILQMAQRMNEYHEEKGYLFESQV